MKFIRPAPVTDTVLVSSTVPEDDYPPWDAGTNYSLGARVIRTQTHWIYERAVAGTTATAPEDDPINWLPVGPTTRWAMFDPVAGTRTTAADTLTVVLEPGRINSLALLNVDAATVTITLVANAETVYSASLDLVDNSRVGNWYDYFYEPIVQLTDEVITDLVDAALLDIPAYGEGVLTVTLAKPGGVVGVGMLAVGLLATLGETEYGLQIGGRDFSRKERNQFGNVTLRQGEYARRIVATALLDAAATDGVARTLTRYRSTPVVWIGSEVYGASVFFGFVLDWTATPDNPTYTTLSIELEEML